MHRSNVIPFDRHFRRNRRQTRKSKPMPHFQKLPLFCLKLMLTVIRRIMTFIVLVVITTGNCLFQIVCWTFHFAFRLLCVLTLILGIFYGLAVWFLMKVAHTHADPHIWQYLGRFEITMLLFLMVGIALELALQLGKGWLYSKVSKAKPLLAWGLK